MICSEKSRITPRRSLSFINSSNIRSSPSVQSASCPPFVLLIKHRRICYITTVEISAQTSFRWVADSSASVCRHAIPLIETALPVLFSRVCTVGCTISLAAEERMPALSGQAPQLSSRRPNSQTRPNQSSCRSSASQLTEAKTASRK
ncbi:hypothetical protein BLNAU_11108 [Blattamonas nauphoetae]|uniref:Uncharacterized protein n=1 Tax=Blattamonas nauphoetae TaxID=2049346 RepID=A0ABQ9XNK7_9EUKA|nr:hypothetical protein BLNAU_11108 [Blattamonas nauphoetae]